MHAHKWRNIIWVQRLSTGNNQLLNRGRKHADHNRGQVLSFLDSVVSGP